MRKLVIALILVGLMALATAVPAFAGVDGETPDGDDGTISGTLSSDDPDGSVTGSGSGTVGQGGSGSGSLETPGGPITP